MPRNLIIAYIATWVIHGSYLTYVWRRWKKVSSGAKAPFSKP
jgi:hypothetical protein